MPPPALRAVRGGPGSPSLPPCVTLHGMENGTTARERLETACLATAARERASVRKYLPDPVPRADVRAMVEFAVRAANAGNAQIWRFTAVDGDETRAALGGAVDARLEEMLSWPELAGNEAQVKGLRAHAAFFPRAPMIVAVSSLPYSSHADRVLALRGIEGDERDRLRARPDLQSIGAAVQMLLVAAHAMGYGACWMCAPVTAAPAIERILGIESPEHLAALVPIGRPAHAVRPRPRRPLEEVLRFI